MLYQKKLCFLFALIATTLIHAQNVLYKATATATGFSQTFGTNVSATRSARWSTTTANTCGIPTSTFTDTASVFDKGRADGGSGNYNNFNFVIEPSNGFRFRIDSITFKISGDSANGVTCRGGLSFHDRFNSSVISQPFFPRNINCTNQTVATYNALSTLRNWIPDFNNYGSNTVDSFANIYLFFYAAKTSSRIRVSEITVWGCVTSMSATKDCNNQPILSRSPFDYSKYQLFLADEFEGTTYNRNTWYPRVGVNGFKGINRDQNNSVSGGVLHMAYTADSVPSSTPGKVYDTAYYTGGLITNNNYKYGYFELKTKLFAPTPGITGFHQSFWSAGMGRTAYIRANELSGFGSGQEIQCFEHDSYDKKLYPTIYNNKNPNNQFYGYYFQQIHDIDVSANFFTAAYEVTPDSMKLYFNGKLRLATAFDEDLQRELLATQVWVTPTPTPVGYWANPCPIPPPGAEMAVDYYRYYLPKSPIGYNFLSNFIFSHGRTKVTDGNKRTPVAWANPLTKDIMGNTIAFDTIAATLDSVVAYPDKLGEKWSMLHRHTSTYRTATRQMMEAIPNGTYSFASYVRCSNKIGDTVELRVRTRNYNNTADTLYKQSVNNFSNIADASWRRVVLNAVPVYNNQAVVEMYSRAAGNSFTYFDSLVFTGTKDTIPTIVTRGCDKGAIKLVAPKDIPETTTYQWQVSTFSNGNYNAWANLGNWGTGTNSTNGFGASYTGALKDTLTINNLNPNLKNARYRCLMTTPATAITALFERYSPVYIFDSINPAIQITAQASIPVYLGGTLRLDADYSGGSGLFQDYAWSGPNNFRDTSLHTFINNFTTTNNGIYNVLVTDNYGCFKSDTILVSALPKPTNSVVVEASYNQGLVAYTNLSLTSNTTNGSGRFAYEWFSPNNTAIGTAKNITVSNVQVRQSGRYVVFVKDSADNFIASDTINVIIAKRTQSINFNTINAVANFTASTAVNVSATSSVGLPVTFTSSNTALAAFVTSNSLGFGRTRNDYSITLPSPITATKFRLYSTQTSHFHIRELRLYTPNSSGYPTDVYIDGGEKTFNGLSNLALQASITASGQFAAGADRMPQNAADSNVSTSWVSQQNGTLPAEKWIQFDFPTAVTIGNIQFLSGFFSGGTWQSPVTLWRLEYWNGSAWINVTDCTVKITATQIGDENTLPAKAEQLLCVNTTNRTVTNQTNTLPVDILSFTVANTNNIATLNWLVANEVNVEKYEIERSLDGLNWKKVGFVNALKINSYSYQDKLSNLTSEALFYRIKSVDFGGAYKYSSIKKILIYNSLLDKQINIYPNPVKNQLTISFLGNNVLKNKVLQIFSANGVKLLEKNSHLLNEKIDVSFLKQGVYLLFIQTDNTIYQQRFMKE